MIEYFCIDEIKGPIIVIKGNFRPKLGEIIKLNCRNKQIYAQVLETSKDVVLVQSFDSLKGLSKSEISVEFTGEMFKFMVSDSLKSRILSGYGTPVDNGPLIYGESREIEGKIIRPSRRSIPHGIIRTGISSIDILNTLIRGQKLPVFSPFS